MNSYLFGRALGTFSPAALQRAELYRLLHALEAAPAVRFDGSDSSSASIEPGGGGRGNYLWAHKAGLNCITIDKFEGK